MTPYKSPSTIELLPALRPGYRSKNPAGGRLIPAGSIGAALRPTSDWTRGLEGISDTRIRFTTDPDQLTLSLPRHVD